MPVRTNLDVLLQQIVYSTMQEDSISSTCAPFMGTDNVHCNSPSSSSVSPSSSDPIAVDAFLFHSDDESCTSDHAPSAFSSPSWSPKHSASFHRANQQYGLTTQRLTQHQQYSGGIAERSYYSTGTLNPKARAALLQLLRRVGSVNAPLSEDTSSAHSASSGCCEITPDTTPRCSNDGSENGSATTSSTTGFDLEDDLMTLPIFLKLRPIRTRVPPEAVNPHPLSSRPPAYVTVPRSYAAQYVHALPASHILSQPAALPRPQPAAAAPAASAANTHTQWLRGGGR